MDRENHNYSREGFSQISASILEYLDEMHEYLGNINELVQKR